MLMTLTHFTPYQWPWPTLHHVNDHDPLYTMWMTLTHFTPCWWPFKKSNVNDPDLYTMSTTLTPFTHCQLTWPTLYYVNDPNLLYTMSMTLTQFTHQCRMTLAHGRLSSHKIWKISPVQSLTKSPCETFLPSKDGPTLFVIKRGTQQKRKRFPESRLVCPVSGFTDRFYKCYKQTIFFSSFFLSHKRPKSRTFVPKNTEC